MPKQFIIAVMSRWTFWLRAKSLSLLLNNGVHHLYINGKFAHSELALLSCVPSLLNRRTKIEQKCFWFFRQRFYKIKNIAEMLKTRVDKGEELIVVVSAMGKTTDQ